MQKRTSAITKIAKTMSAVALVLMLVVPTFANAAVINGTTVAGNHLTITGSGFSGTPLTVTFDGQKLAVVSSTPTQIVATLAPIPAPGSYRLVVKAANASATSSVAISAAPNTVAQVVLKGQTTTIPTTTIFTPQSDGLYRISGYGTTTVPGSQGYWNVIFGWTDDAGAEQNSAMPPSDWLLIPTNASWGFTGTLTLVVNANAGMPLTYSVGIYDGSTTGSTYELFITVEQLM